MRITLRTAFIFLWSMLCLSGISRLAYAAVSEEQLTVEEELRGLVPEDYFDFVFVSSPQISPDSQQVLFVQTTTKDDASGRNNQIYKIDEDGVVSEFTQGTSDRSPLWSPDGKYVAFIRPADGKSQVFIMPVNGGEAKQLTSVEDGVSGFSWFPDNKRLLLTVRVEPDDGTPDEDSDEETTDKGNKDKENNDKEHSDKRAEPDIVVVKNARYIANGAGFLNEKRKHLFVFDIETEALTQLTSGADWNANSPQLSPDGQHVYFHANKTGLEYEGDPNSDIFKLNIATKEMVALVADPDTQYSVTVSSDGEKLTYLQAQGPFSQSELYLHSESSEAQNLTAGFDRNAAKPLWSPDSKTLYFTTRDNGAHNLFSVNVNGSKVNPLLESKKSIRNLAVSPDGKFLVFSRDSSTELPELYRFDLREKALTRLTGFNNDLLAKRKLSAARDFWFENEKGMKVQGFVHMPIDFDEDKTYPLVLNIKGGPGGMWGHQWFHENQMYVAKGYAVAYVNYRGSAGYGLEHRQEVYLGYGIADSRDNIQFLDAVLEKHQWIDKERLYITGGSHGGFLTNWITTQTKRFKAAVTQRSVSNWISEAGTQQFTPKQMTIEFGGNLWTNFDYYWDRSPLKFADRVTTPTLIIHSDSDMITPIGQGQEWFYALKANDVPVEMVIFKGETHSLSRTGTPTNLVERLDRILDWFERYP